MGRLTELAGTWRQHAEMLRRYGDERGAAVLEAIAGQLEEALSERESEVLTLSQASAESGYSKRRLRELVAEGKLENRGEKGRPRILRRDLPLKPSRNGNGKPNGGPSRRADRGVRYDPLQDARSLVGRMATG